MGSQSSKSNSSNETVVVPLDPSARDAELEKQVLAQQDIWNKKKEEDRLRDQKDEEKMMPIIVGHLGPARPCSTFYWPYNRPNEYRDVRAMYRVCKRLAEKDGRFTASFKSLNYSMYGDEDEMAITVCFDMQKD